MLRVNETQVNDKFVLKTLKKICLKKAERKVYYS